MKKKKEGYKMKKKKERLIMLGIPVIFNILLLILFLTCGDDIFVKKFCQRCLAHQLFLSPVIFLLIRMSGSLH